MQLVQASVFLKLQDLFDIVPGVGRQVLVFLSQDCAHRWHAHLGPAAVYRVLPLKPSTLSDSLGPVRTRRFARRQRSEVPSPSAKVSQETYLRAKILPVHTMHVPNACDSCHGPTRESGHPQTAAHH